MAGKGAGGEVMTNGEASVPVAFGTNDDRSAEPELVLNFLILRARTSSQTITQIITRPPNIPPTIAPTEPFLLLLLLGLTTSSVQYSLMGRAALQWK